MPGVSLSDRTLYRKLQKIQKMPGPAGADGADGAPGSIITSGTAAPDNGDGNDIDVYLQVDADDVVLKTYQKAAGVWVEVGDVNPEWTDYTPTITSITGTITTASGVGRYQRLGDTVFITVSITILTNGTGATGVLATLPTTSPTSNVAFAGAEFNVGKSLIGVSGTGLTRIAIYNYDLTYPGFDGANLVVSGTYEVA